MSHGLAGEYHLVSQRLIAAGLRPTRQRLLLGHLLFSGGYRHVTAEALHRESKESGTHVSLATVYNTLHQFITAGLIKEVTVENGRSYFDTNTESHHHFYNKETGQLMDIPASEIGFSQLPCAPDGAAVDSVEVIIRLRGAAAQPAAVYTA
jgi:Fur family iron response transcriptional regulator